MPFKVFLTYGPDPQEQVTAWRLQTLATAHGIHVFVPQRSGVGTVQRASFEEAKQAIDQSDCVLAIIVSSIGPAVEAELTYAIARKKLIIPIVCQGVVEPEFLSGLRIFRFVPWDLANVESQVLEYLKTQKLSKDKQQTLGALVAIGLGMLLLFSLAEK